MIIFPAIDLHHGCAVRLLRGDYNQMTEYSDSPEDVAAKFAAAGAGFLHVVDLEGAKTGIPVNLNSVAKITSVSGLRVQLGGGIRSMEVLQSCLEAGVARVILGTAALRDPAFLEAAVNAYGEAVAVGVDVRDGKVAVNGWTELSDTDFRAFCHTMETAGVQTVICTDISKDGAMQGTNR
ncbi:MAG TPA: 1-(5-phosphoribosyl)-5-((5-phosphoribosylamino)methylideneamino)imidazole-4-carboxamide isomerase, partial [Candidatus Egerieisoma faecipullorum]|nr:1-(5-phosphoribosyl)-5-((5-phosphoribosylamino)methylideneamino)imidazole-4-carboxamide isomerase [Candidatus Egerieisoma faecipullorum]